MIKPSKKFLKVRCKGCGTISIFPEEVYQTSTCKKCGGTQFDLINVEKEVITK